MHVEHIYNKKMNRMNNQTIKKAETKLVRGLLDLVVLGLLKEKSLHGYAIITSIRKNFGVYFGPSTVYPLLGELEAKNIMRARDNFFYQNP